MSSIEVPADEIHLWESALSVDEQRLRALEQLLPDDEAASANRFRHPHARRQYLVSRGNLRALLASYTGTPAPEVPLGVEGEGKPVLLGLRTIDFNLSHSGDLVLYAIAQSRRVGVDVEHLRPVPRALDLARRFMGSEEHAALEGASPEERDRTFLAMWVRCEAYAKAQGISVWRALGPSAMDWKASGRAYTVRTVEGLDGYVAAVVAAGNDWKIVRCGRVSVA